MSFVCGYAAGIYKAKPQRRQSLRFLYSIFKGVKWGDWPHFYTILWSLAILRKKVSRQLGVIVN